MFRRALKPVAIGATTALSLGVVSLAVDAPMADKGDGAFVHKRETTFPEWLHNIGRVPLFVAATTVGKFYLEHRNSFHAEGAEAFRASIENRPPGTAIITVSNHSATVDDPGVIASYVCL